MFIFTGIVFLGVAFWLLAGGWDYIREALFIETVYVDAEYEAMVIHRPATTVHLTITGDGNDVEVTANTALKDLVIDGNENSIFLCEGIHDPNLENDGEENEIIFSFC